MVGTRPRERWGSPKSSDSEARALRPRQHLQASPEHSQPASSSTGTGQGCVTTQMAPGDKPLVLYRPSGIHKQKAAGSSQTELLPKRNHHSEDNTEGRSTDGTLTFEQNKGASVPCPDCMRIHCLQPQIGSVPAKSRAAQELKEGYGGW